MIRYKGKGCTLWARVEDGPLCERCRRLKAIGALAEVVFRVIVDDALHADRGLHLHSNRWGISWHGLIEPARLDALDALADLLTDHAVLRRRHRRELAEEQRDAQRGAAESFASGMLEGMDQRNRG